MNATRGPSPGRGRERVAIIGTGLAGLHAAHLLSETEDLRQRFEVHLFEKGDELGLDGSSITVEGTRIDVPLRSFNAGYYPKLMKLYKKLDIPIKKNNFTFSFSTMSAHQSPILLYNGRNGLRGFSLPWHSIRSVSLIDFLHYISLLTSFITSYFALLFIALYHNACGHLGDPKHTLADQALHSWLKQHSRLISPTFVEIVLISLFSAMTTSSISRVQQIPASEVLLYIATTFLRDHYTIQGGVQRVQDRLIRTIPKDNIHTSMAIEKVTLSLTLSDDEKNDDSTDLIDLHATDTIYQQSRRFEGFHHVIFATPANLSASLLESYKTSLSGRGKKDGAFAHRMDLIQGIQEELSQVCYESSSVINHTDESILPKVHSDWRDLNLVSPASLGEGSEGSSGKSSKSSICHHTMATHVCSQLKDKSFIFQTTNPILSPCPSSILSKSTFQRALTQSKSRQHRLFCWVKQGYLQRWQLQLGPLQGRQNVQKEEQRTISPAFWFCGSYSQGIPLLEGCVSSSSLVADQIIQQGTGSG
ncbi:hypothetical protein CBS101457_004493 [Exobasidium rhododendri]|nr:hypothetical protein CBS101457_004493 [Exobasidium rhododendri]